MNADNNVTIPKKTHKISGLGTFPEPPQSSIFPRYYKRLVRTLVDSNNAIYIQEIL